MAANCPPIKIQQFDNNGDPAVGYKLYTYTTGTTTPKATYSDAAGSTPNANPIILDARGEATVFLTPIDQYRFVLKTAADVTVWTQDGVSAAAYTAGDGISISAAGVVSLHPNVDGNGLTQSGNVLNVGAGTGILVTSTAVSIDDAAPSDAYGFVDDDKVMTTARMRDVFYTAIIGNAATVPDFTSRSPNASSWTIVRNSAGNYTITHNLGLSGSGNNMVIIPVSINAGGQEIEQTARTANTFTIITRDSSGTLDDANFAFIAMRFGA